MCAVVARGSQCAQGRSGRLGKFIALQKKLVNSLVKFFIVLHLSVDGTGTEGRVTYQKSY